MTLMNVRHMTKARENTHLPIIAYFPLGTKLINILLTLISTTGMFITFSLCELIVCHLLSFSPNTFCSNLCSFCAKREDKYFTLSLTRYQNIYYRCISACAQTKTKNKQTNKHKTTTAGSSIATFLAIQGLKV